LWGNSTSKLLRVAAQVVDPKKIKIVEEHLAIVGSETLRVTEKDTLIVKNSNVMDCIESVQCYDVDTNGLADTYSRPRFSAILHGSLHIITTEEESELQTELALLGAIPQANVEGSSSFDP
jgi:hypothetical protein